MMIPAAKRRIDLLMELNKIIRPILSGEYHGEARRRRGRARRVDFHGLPVNSTRLRLRYDRGQGDGKGNQQP
jgi:hypothetical protein